jgi:olefin beta-lactone synthetase
MSAQHTQNIFDLLSANAQASPKRAAIIERLGRGVDTTTYSALRDMALSTASTLTGSGLKAGSRVLVMVPMSRSLYVILLALFKLRAVAMFVDPSASKAHIRNCCKLYPPDALIGTSKSLLFLTISFPEIRQCPLRFAADSWLPGAVPLSTTKTDAHDACTAIVTHNACTATVTHNACTATVTHNACTETDSLDSGALLTFTSGSTGLPKAIMRTHRFLLSQHEVLQHTLHIDPGQIHLISLPVFVLANLASGATTIIPDCDLRHPSSAAMENVVRQLQALSPECAVAPPALFEQLADKCQCLSVKLSCLKRIFTGGGPVFPNLLRKLARLAPEARIVAVYGSTEAEPIAEIAFSDISASDWQAMSAGAGLLAGKPVAQSEVAIIPPDLTAAAHNSTQDLSTEHCMPAGQIGEILVSGNHVVKGYLGGIGDLETKITINGNIWHRTGDGGYFDEQGRLWLTGRITSRIQDDRGTLFPFAVEAQVLQSALVRRCAILAKDGKRVLYVELKPGYQRQLTTPVSRTGSTPGSTHITTHLHRLLSGLPLDEVRILEHIPVDKRHNSKIDYTELARIA